MSTLLGYARMAEQHWREHCPKLVRQLERENRLEAALAEAEATTHGEMEALMRELRRTGSTSEEAYRTAWELVREKYLLLPAE